MTAPRINPSTDQPYEGDGPTIMAHQSTGAQHYFYTGEYNGFQGANYYGRLAISTDASYFQDSYYMGTTLTAKVGDVAQTLVSSAPFNVGPKDDVILNQTVHEWVSPNANEPWFVQLQVGDMAPDNLRVCWHVRLPGMCWRAA